MKKILCAILSMIAGVALAADLPDSRMTPGATNQEVTQTNIGQTVCVKGFTKTIRPPAYFTNSLKKQQIREYGYADQDPRQYEEDHLIALSIGGAPANVRNLWPQPRSSEWGADQKNQLELVMFKMVCAHEISLKDAQYEMATDWIKAWKAYVPGHKIHQSKPIE